MRLSRVDSQWNRSEDHLNGSSCLTCAATIGGWVVGGPLTQQRMHPARIQGMEGATLTRQRANPARRLGTKECGVPLEQHCVLPAHDLQEM